MLGQARVLKNDVDKNQSLVVQYQIQAAPTPPQFRNEQVVWKKAGGADKMTLK